MADLSRLRSYRTSGRAAAAAVLLLAAGVDLAFGKAASLTVTLVFGPFVASALLSRRDTAVFGATAVVAAFVLGWPDGTAGTAAHVVRTGTVALGAMLATRLASERTHRESKLAAVMTVAEVTQQAILHPLPDELGGLRLAGQYISASADARVGGDFYDAVATPWGTRLVIGDVRGKGLDAVQLTARLLGEFRSRAATEADLAGIVSRLDRVAAEAGGPEDFATAVLVQYQGGTTTFLRCGHPQPLHRRAGSATELEIAGTFPLGLGADGTRQTVLRMDAGEQLLFFSDGAIETRNQDGHDFDIASAFGGAPHDPPDALEHVLDALRNHAAGVIADDVVLVLAEAESLPRPPTPTTRKESHVRHRLPRPAPRRPRPRVGR